MAIDPMRAQHDPDSGKTPKRKADEASLDSFPASDPPAPGCPNEPSWIIGVLGSFVGAMVGRALGMYREGESAGFLMALAGAVLLTFGYQAIAHRRGMMRH